MRRSLFCLYLLVSVAATFLALEGALRLADHVPDALNVPRFHPGMHGDLEPYQRLRDVTLPNLPFRITATSEGTRGLRPFTVRKPDGVLRVLCIGDSFTFGYGVNDEHTYPEYLLHELEHRYPSRKIEVINSGIPLFGILDEMDYFLQKGAALKPDIVVLQFFANDVDDLTRPVVFRENLAHDPVFSRWGVLSRLFDWSRLYQAAEYIRVPFLKEFADPHSVDTTAHGKVVTNQGLDPYRFKSTQEERDFAHNANNVLGPESGRKLSRVWQAYGKALEGLRDMVRAAGAEMLFVEIPDIIEMENGLLYADHQELASIVNALDIPAIDMLDPFREARFIQYVNPYLAPLDGHCSAYGNSLVARAVAERLRLESSSDGQSALLIEPGAPLRSLAGAMTVDLHITPDGPLACSAGPGLSGKLESASGCKVLRGEETPLDTLLVEGGQDARAELILAFHADAPLSRVEIRLPCSVKPAPGLRSSLSVEFSLDGEHWEMLVRHVSEDPAGGSGFEQYVLLDKDIGDLSARDFRVRVRMSGKTMLYTERPGGEKRTRVMTVTGFPLERPPAPR